MHKEVLVDVQASLLPLVRDFRDKFVLVGGTAIALQIGHRQSLDFDLFTDRGFRNHEIRNQIASTEKIDAVFVDKQGEYTLVVNGVKFTFFRYPYPIEAVESLDEIARMPNLLTLAAMKAFALGRRAKWKDYVDLYFILKDHHSLAEICEAASALFGREFNEKFFRAQLAYFEDVNYTEHVIYLPGFAVADQAVKDALTAMSLA